MTSPARMAGAGALLLALVATVCTVLGGGNGVGATGLLQSKSASAAAVTSLVFTAQVGRNVELPRAAPRAVRLARA
jgi:alpha-D-ribose 1-methylphosphonate 5-triphosphate synthase subunit PhnL